MMTTSKGKPEGKATKKAPAWDGMCEAGKHGADFKGQPCNLCLRDTVRGTGLREAVEGYRGSVGGNLLLISLEAAVPLWAERWRAWLRLWEWERVVQRAQELSQIVASEGDNILFRGAKKGDSARAFNALAEGLALLSMFPGGVKFLGEKWEHKKGGPP
jgi:hypothetical protein